MELSALREAIVKKYGTKRACGPKTDIVIEGYPRSSNSFTVSMLKLFDKNEPRISIAHHTHSVDNLRLGIGYGIPVVVLARPPEDALLSYLIYSNRTVEFVARHYISFYSGVLALDATPIAIDFHSIVTDFNSVVSKNNFGLQGRKKEFNFSNVLDADVQFVKSAAHQRAVAKFGEVNLSRVSTPTEQRENLKLERRAEVRDYLSQHPEIKELYLETVALRQK